MITTRGRTQRLSPLVTLSMLSTFAVLLCNRGVRGIATCPYEPFPGHDYMQTRGGAWHIQGDFYVNVSNAERRATVPILIEHPGTYLRLALGSFSSGYTMSASISTNTNTLLTTDSWGHLSGTITEVGSYDLTITGTPSSSSSSSANNACTHGHIEFFARSGAVMKEESEYYSKERCKTQSSVLPEIDFTDISNFHYVSDMHIDDGDDYYVIPNVIGHISSPWEFSVPSDAAASYRFAANLRTEFGSGGFLRLLLQPNYNSSSSSFPTDVAECVRRGGCVLSEHDHLNSASIAAFLPPGSYALWLYWGEASHYNSTVSPRCVPFGLTLDITAGGDGAEGFTACTALPLPATLNSGARGSGTETLDSNGCIHMHRSVLVESVRGHSTTVALSRKSHLRVHVISPDDVDIDIYVRDADTGHIITSSTRTSSGSGMPEAVSAVLPEGRYAIEFSRLTGGLPAGSLCNSFELDLAIAPTTTTTATATHKDFCADVGKTVLPNLEGMSKLSEFSGEFHFGEASTGFPYLYTSTTGNYKQEVITEQEFETVAATMFRARVGSNFLLNDVTMSITNMDTEEVLYPRHAAPNAQVFDIFLNPGHYAFRVHSGLVQDTFDYTIGSDYPRCALYTLALDVVPVHTLSTEELLCRGYRVLPTTFNDAEWLETSDTRLHTTETLRGPRLTPTTPTNSSAALMTGTSTATINVERTAYLRVFVGSANTRDIDIDLLLLTKDAVLADAHSFGATTTTNGESISYILEPDVDYTLRLDFLRYSSSSSSDECFTYPMEVMIAPYNESSSVPMCKDSKIPTSAKVFPSSGIIDNTFEHVDTYWMPRDDSRSSSSNMVMARLSFTVPQLTRFRALVTGDFLYSQLALRLEETERGYTSELLYGGYELSAQSLAPGTYTLVIYAPYDSKTLPEGPIRTACIETTLHIGAEPVYLSGSSSSSSSICEYSTVPDTLNTPGFVHMLTGQHVVINGRYRASVGDGRKSDGSYHDHINFNLNKTMLYRVLVPDARNTGGLDVDVTIHRGTTEIIKELVDKSENSESADMLYGILQPDNYVLTFTYYGAAAAIVAGGGGSSSLSYTCMSFPVYAEFGPNESYESTDSCEEKVTVPGEILFNEEVTETLFWSPSARKQYSASIPFAVYADAARVRMELLTKAFVPGGLTFHITGHTQSGLLNVSARVDAAVGAEGRAWLDEYLLSGTYTLWITDLASRAVHEAVEYVGCAEYNLTYYIDTTVDPNSEGICTQAESLPSDLYTERGGSIEYGGPQADDGTALVAGEHFLLPNSRAFKDRTRWTQITISEPSFVRVYAQTQEPDDVDVFLYRDRNNISSYIGASISAGDYENALWYVNPERDTGINDGGNGLSTTYDIQTRVDTVDEVQACNYFQWAVAVRPRSKAAGDIACPASLPPEADRVPRETIRVQGAQTLVPSSPSYVLTSAFIDAHTLESKLFRYRMTLDVRGSAGAVVTAAASFNFLLSDLRLVLRDSVTEQVLSASMGPKSLPNRRNTLNFRSTLAVVLSKGKYYLDLEEDIRGKATFLNTTYCIPFDFTLLARSDGGSVVSDSGSDSESGSAVIIGGGPEITYVDPQNMWDIEPCDNLYIDIHFSECPANVYAERDNLTAFLNAHGQKMVRMVEIEDYEEAPTVFPIDYAILSENAADDWVLGLRFAAEKLIIASTYILRLNSSAFVTAGGEPFADPAAAAGVKYRYMMSICDCGGHGLCDVTGVSSECLRCECDVPWTGPNCAACMEGYHAFGDTCVEDPVCGPDSCNGHGTCDASSGSIVCTCATGYASPTDAENNPCSICALGYTGYPDCVYDAAAAGADCADPLLPASLATVPYLGWKGYADVAGTFHVDTHRFSHDIEFALDRDSIFRVYAAPNSDFDVDLWLYSVDPTDASLTIIAYEISMDSAETMFLTLAGGPSASAPAKYLLRLRYYIWSNNNNNNEFNENVKKKMIRSTGMSGTTTTSVCESIDFSLSIAPVDATKPALDEMVKRCAAEDDLPEVPFTEVTDSVSYDPGHNFTVRAVRGAWAEPRYFWSHDFTVCAKGYHTAMLQAHVGSRFLPGQVVMALERHPADGSEPNHCDTDSSTGRCALGEAALNGNFLHRALQPGAYRLWLLEPALQDLALANCSLFEFSFRIDYLDVAESVFECDGSDLPATLNAPGFLGTTNTTTGSVHIHDHYAIYGNASSVAFELTEASHFRVASLSSSSSTSTTSSSNNDGTLFSLCINGTCTAFASTIIHALNPGQYLLHVQPPVSWLSEDDGRIVKCINVGLELAIEPVARVVAAPCPASLAEPDPATVLPEFGTYGPPLSYGINDSESGSGFGEYLEFMASAPYKAVSTRVAQYTIVITELSTFDVSVMSSFLYHDLGMTLYFLSGGEQFRVAGSRRGYNSQRIQATLIAGTYLLTLDVPDSPRPESLPSCLPFNFVIRVMPFSDSSALCELEGEPLPASFNGRRFAGTSGFDYLGTEFRVAYGLLGDEETYIPINITAPTSLVKVYVPPNNVVDIDIALMNSVKSLTRITNYKHCLLYCLYVFFFRKELLWQQGTTKRSQKRRLLWSYRQESTSLL